MTDSISAMPGEIAAWLSEQTDLFPDVTFITEFPAIPKATPLRQTIAAIGLDHVRIRDFFTENSQGVQVPDEYCRLAKVRIRISVYVPYSAGGSACHTAFTKIVDCLNFKSDFNISESGCESIEADRDTDAFVLKSWVDIDAQFCPAESSAVQYASFLPKTLFRKKFSKAIAEKRSAPPNPMQARKIGFRAGMTMISDTLSILRFR